MTREQKELLLKDLCERIPHGVKIRIPSWDVPSWDESEMEYVDRVDTLYSVSGDNYVIATNEYYDFCVEDIKPYLFPLSSMTEEQKKNLFKIGGIDIIYGNFYTNSEFTLEETLSGINWLLENHFDIHGLIPLGLAIDATGLNIY